MFVFLCYKLLCFLNGQFIMCVSCCFISLVCSLYKFMISMSYGTLQKVEALCTRHDILGYGD